MPTSTPRCRAALIPVTILLACLAVGSWACAGRVNLLPGSATAERSLSPSPNAPESSPTSTLTATSEPSPSATATAEPSPTMSATPKPTETLSPTPTATLSPTPTALAERILDVPLFLQELPLSCEAAAIRMVLAGLLGQAPVEKDVLACMPRNANPNLGFRGNPAGYNRNADGSPNWDNYGVYAPAVAEALNHCALDQSGKGVRALVVKEAGYEEIAKSVLDGYPVIVWVSRRADAPTVTVETPEGPVRLVLGEHVWVVVGYHADGTFTVHDPYPQKDKKQTFRVRAFMNWDLFDRMAVLVVPPKGAP